jgi:hypothetical protein
VRESQPGEYVASLQVPPMLNVGDYTVGVWFGTAYETILQEMTLHRFRLEGDVKHRPKRIVDLGLPWKIVRVTEHAGPLLHVADAEQAVGPTGDRTES